MLDIKKIQKEALFSSIAISDDYFQRNQLLISDFRPVAITTEKKISGWSSAVEQLTTGILNVAYYRVDKKVFVKVFDHDLAPSIQGFCIECEKTATIYVNSHLNFCWKRFIVAKELSHLLMNKVDGELRNCDMLEVKNLLSVLVSGSPVKNNSQASEYMAYLGAMELLIPKQYVKSKLLELPIESVSEKIKCPIPVIEYRVNNSKIFDDIYKDPNSELAMIRAKFYSSS